MAIAYVLAAIALLGLLPLVAFSLLLHLRAPASSTQTATLNTYLLQQAAARLTQEAKDVDGDGIPEAPAAAIGATAPTGGGNIPGSSAAPKDDAYGVPIGYCSWDNGSLNSSPGRIAGDNPATQKSTLFAVVSAGPDKVFQTTCSGLLSGTAGGDDSARWVVVAAANQAAGGNVWFGDPVADVTTLNALGTGTITPGEVRLMKANNYLYQWNGAIWVNLSLAPAPTDGHRNFLINGMFDIWQRGTSFSPAASTDLYTADRWRVYLNASAGATITRQAIDMTDANRPSNATYALQLAVSAANTYAELQQPIESVQALAGQTATLSLYARTTTGAQQIRPALVQHFGTGGSPSGDQATYGSYVTLSTNWQKFTQTFAVPGINGKTFGANGDDYLLVVFQMNSSSSPPLQFTQIQLEAGSTASSFEYRTIGKELLLCQRYYEIFNRGTALYTNPYIPSGSTYVQPWSFLVDKRKAPGVTLTDAGSTGVGAPGVNSVAVAGFTEARTASTTGQATIMTNWTADAELL